MNLRVAMNLGLAAVLSGALGLGAAEASSIPTVPAPVVQASYLDPDQSVQPVQWNAPNEEQGGNGKSNAGGNGNGGNGNQGNGQGNGGTGGNGVGTGSGDPQNPINPNPGKSDPNGKGLDNEATGHVNHGTVAGRASAPGDSGDAPALGHCKDRGNGHLYRDDGSACDETPPPPPACGEGTRADGKGNCIPIDCPAGTHENNKDECVPNDPGKCPDGMISTNGQCVYPPTYCTVGSLVNGVCTTGDPGTPGTNNPNTPQIVSGVSVQRAIVAPVAAAPVVVDSPVIVAGQSRGLPASGDPTLLILAGGLVGTVVGKALQIVARDL